MFRQKQLLSKICFLKQSELGLKLQFFYFMIYRLVIIRLKVISLATALIVHLRSQFNYVFALLNFYAAF